MKKKKVVKKTGLPVTPIEKILKKVGKIVGVERVSKEAATALTKHLEDIGIEISESAVRVAKHAKRTTVKTSDIKLAIK